ncbi:hypothetical protein HZB02_02090 [Candidatus Woesearchaeota archaeon]|nr:hypothetical protein [Candidatus Woesearchaeota archaeon]
MATTVAVRNETMALLKEMKAQTHVESFDELIQHLIQQAKKPKQSFYGVFSGLGDFKREKRDRFD